CRPAYVGGPGLAVFCGPMPESLQPLAAWFVEQTYLVVFVAALIDSTGIPFPGRLSLVAAGAYSARGDVDPIAVMLAGARGVALTTFVLFDAMGSLLWSTVWVGLGWALGDHALDAAGDAGRVGIAMAGAGVVVVLSLRVYRNWGP